MNDVHFSWKIESALVRLLEAGANVLEEHAKKVNLETTEHTEAWAKNLVNKGELK